MASPVDAARVGTAFTSAADPWSVTLPASSAGQLLVVFLRNGSGATFNLPSGWGWLINNDVSDASDDATALIYKWTDGSEGTTLSVDLSAAAKGAAIAVRITGAANPAVQGPQFTFTVGTTANADPTIVAPSGGLKDYLFILFLGLDGRGLSTSSPSGYSAATSVNSGTGGAIASNVHVAQASRQATVSTENPGPWTSTSPNSAWLQTVVTIHPATAAPIDKTLTPATETDTVVALNRDKKISLREPWLPATPTDAFNRTNEGHPMTGWLSYISGADGLAVISNQCGPEVVGSNDALWALAQEKDHGAAVKMVTAPHANGNFHLFARSTVGPWGTPSSDLNAYALATFGTSWMEIRRFDAGAAVALAGGPVPVTIDGEWLAIICVGNVIEVWMTVNGVWRRHARAVDSTYDGAAPNQYVGAHINGGGVDLTGRFDDFYAVAVRLLEIDEARPLTKTKRITIKPATQDVFDFSEYALDEVWSSPSSHGRMEVPANFTGSWNQILDDAGNRCIEMISAAAATAGETYAGLIKTVENFSDHEFTIRYKTLAHTRTSGPANPWEVAWVFFRYVDDDHFYWFLHKTDGFWEIGRGDPAYGGGQRFLASGDLGFAHALNTWYTVKIRVVGPEITIWLDGSLVGTATDTDDGIGQPPSHFASGAIAPYMEDSKVHYDDIIVHVVTDRAMPLSVTHPIHITLGVAAHTNTAQALSVTKPIRKTLGPATETDAAQVLTFSQEQPHFVTLTPAAEASTALPLDRDKRKSLIIGAEADTAQALDRDKRRGISFSSETDAARPLAAIKRKTLAVGTEADTAQLLDRDKRRGIVLVAETDEARALRRPKLALVTEVDTAIGLSVSQEQGQFVSIAPTTEIDASRPLTVTKPIRKSAAVVTEADSARPLSVTKIIRKTLALVAEADAAVALVRRKLKTLGIPAETDVARPLTVTKPIRKTLGLASEIDAAQTLSKGETKSLSAAIEVDSARPLIAIKTIYKALAAPTELDSARPLTFSQPHMITLGLVTEVDLAQTLTIQNSETLAFGRARLLLKAKPFVVAPQCEPSHTPICGTFLCGDGTIVGRWHASLCLRPKLTLTGRTYGLQITSADQTTLTFNKGKIRLLGRATALQVVRQPQPGKAKLTLKGRSYTIFYNLPAEVGRPRLILVGKPVTVGLSTSLSIGRPKLLLKGRPIAHVGFPGLVPTTPEVGLLTPITKIEIGIITVPAAAEGELLIPTTEVTL